MTPKQRADAISQKIAALQGRQPNANDWSAIYRLLEPETVLIVNGVRIAKRARKPRAPSAQQSERGD